MRSSVRWSARIRRQNVGSPNEIPLDAVQTTAYVVARCAILLGECDNMEIRSLEKEAYAGKRFTARYRTSGYYDIGAFENGFQIKYTPFEATVERSFDDVFFGEWLENPIAFGAFEGEKLLGYVEGSPESWNNRFRISNICVFDKARRGRGIGTLLMAAIEGVAASLGARMIVLETQSCNEAAIAFYRRNGYQIIGFDLYAYSNADPERREVRIEMGKKRICAEKYAVSGEY